MSKNKANESKKVGDELFITERNLSSMENNNTNISYGYYQNSQIDDLLRKKFGAFWVRTMGSKPHLLRSKVPFGTPIREINLIRTSTSPETGITEQEMELTLTRTAREQREEIKDFLRQGDEFFDHSTVINIYEEGNNLAEQAIGVLNLYAEIKSDYNFLQDTYEAFLSSEDENIREIDLPNFYNFLMIDSGDKLEKVTRNVILTQGGSIKLGEQTSLTSEKMKPVSDYFTKWSNNFLNYKNNSPGFALNSKMNKVFFTKKETERLDELYLYKELFPMMNTIEFNVENDAKIGTILEQTNFSSQLKGMMRPSSASNFLSTEVRSNMSERLVSNDGEQVFEEGSTTTTVSNESRILYDIDSFFDGYEPFQSDELFLNDDILDGSGYRAFYNLMSIITKGKIEKVKKEVYRDFKELIQGKTAYSEPVFYKINKYDEENNLLQTFNFTNTEKLEVIKFVDTQVKFDKRYRYEIVSCNLVVGTKYRYEFLRHIGALTPARRRRSEKIRFKVFSEPSVKIIEVPVFEKSVIIHDNPPIAPEMTPIFFRGINNKVKFFFNSATGRYKTEPVLFKEGEEAKINKYKIAQDVAESEKEIMFETDDTVVSFTLYKMTSKPKTYQDFEDKGESLEIETNKASSASYLDTISPNKKYYYCLRARDYHENLSYPSVIYEVEIIDDSGSIYPSSKICEFDKPVFKQDKKGVKRFIHIKPSFRNLLSNDEEMNLENTDGPEIGQRVVLGEGGEVTWGKKFKLRLTSKSTGKKIDFNFTFNTKQDRELSEST